MKIKHEIEFYVLASNPKVIFIETNTGIPLIAAKCETQKEAHLICHLLNEVIKGRVYPGPIANESERGDE